MSDIEDGELLSCDEEHDCLEDEKNELKIKFNIQNNILHTKDSSQWNYEQNNIKVQSSNGSSDSEEDYQQQNCCNKDERSSDQDDFYLPKPHETIETSRKRNSDHFITDHSSEHDSSDQYDLPQPKRRILCKYYAAGDCENGATCVFMHGDFPCKFFHDEISTCRAADNCKFSHEPLSEEMKKVLDDFIQEGKEKLIHSAISTIKNASFINSFSSQPQSRPTCLLPTPVMTTSDYDPDFSNSYRDISNYPSTKLSASSKMHDIIPNYPIANKLQFLRNLSKQEPLDFHRPGKSFISRNGIRKFPPKTLLSTPSFSLNTFQRPFHNIGNSDKKHHDIESQRNEYGESLVSNEENIVPDYFSKREKQLNSKIHAPARFIVNNQQEIKIEPHEEEPQHFDIDYKDALKKLADQIVVDSKSVSPNYERSTSVNDYRQMSTINGASSFDTSHILKDRIEMETLGVGIDDTISKFKDDNDMNESEKMYIQRMKSLDTEFENTIPWKAKRLEPTNKQPYLLYILKVNDIHDNPLADPRLIGHPVLNYYLKKSRISSDNEEYTSLMILQDEELENDHFDNSL